MLKYVMRIDGEVYIALFKDHIEAADFLDCNEQDGSDVIVYSYKEVTWKEIWEDDDFEDAYKVEMIANMLLLNSRNFHKVDDMEKELKRLGFLA